MWISADKARQSISSSSTGPSDTFWLQPASAGGYFIRVQSNDRALTAGTDTQNTALYVSPDGSSGYQRWTLQSRTSGAQTIYWLTPVGYPGSWSAAVPYGATEGSIGLDYHQSGSPNTEWLLNPSSTLNPDAQATYNALSTSISGWDSEIATLDARIAWLQSALTTTDSTNLQTQLTTAQNDLAAAKTALATQAGIVLSTLRQATSSSQGRCRRWPAMRGALDNGRGARLCAAGRALALGRELRWQPAVVVLRSRRPGALDDL